MVGEHAAPGDAPGRSTIWANIGYSALLVPQTIQASLSCDGVPGIYVCLISVADGILDTLILPHVNTDCMQVFIDEVSSRHPGDRIVMILDGAGWHKAKKLTVPSNMRLLSLPPYAPELNPVEHLWDELREKNFGNLVFNSLDALEDHLEEALRLMERDAQRVYSIVGWPWIINSLLN